MLRKVLAAAGTTLGVIAGTAAIGVIPATANITPPPTPVANPSLEGCGIPITLVMDASGSVYGYQSEMKTAAKAFLSGLEDTSSSARIVDFSTTARQIAARTDIRGAGLTSLEDAIDTKYYVGGDSGGMTNWQMPLWLTNSEPIPADGLVVFLTDGDPNTVGGFNGIPVTYPSSQDATNAAQVYSDLLKTDGNRVLAVGIGMNSNPDSDQAKRLKQISGPLFTTSVGATDTINSFDVLVTDDFDALEPALMRVASSLCGGSITVKKSTDVAKAGTYEPAGDWTFSAKVTPGTVPDDFTWMKPAGETSNTATLTTQSTDDPATNGVVQFQYSPKNTDVRTVRVSETLKAGYSPRTDPNSYTCTFKGIDPPAAQSGALKVDADKAYFDITLKADESASCDVYNTRDLGSLTITKEFNAQASGYTGTFDITYSCVNGADKVKEGSLALAAGKSETISGLPTGTVCTVTEPTLPANPSGWTFNPPTFTPSNQATVTKAGSAVTVVNSVAQVNPVVVKKACPINVTLHKPQPTMVGNRVMTDKITTKKSNCSLQKPVVLCRPLGATSAGETAFCTTKVSKKGKITVKTEGYEAVKVSVVVKVKAKVGSSDTWKGNTWRKSWKLK